jgi:hypothetical protein
MSSEEQDKLFDLLTKKALFGLDEAEQRELDAFDAAVVERELLTLELTAAAIGTVGLDTSEPMPAHLREQIAEDAKYIVGVGSEASAGPAAGAEPWPPTPKFTVQDDDSRASAGWFGWLGWAAAAAACVALAVNLWFTQLSPTQQPPQQAQVQPTPKPLTLAEQREELLRSGGTIVQANWAPGNVKDIKDISGDIVWSEEKQAGFMRFRGLPVKGAPEFCYQLWIFDKVQDEKTPIDGGIFDVTTDGEIIVPISAKLQVTGPQMFAITIERHGGVVVSKREKIAALAKVETRAI